MEEECTEKCLSAALAGFSPPKRLLFLREVSASEHRLGPPLLPIHLAVPGPRWLLED